MCNNYFLHLLLSHPCYILHTRSSRRVKLITTMAVKSVLAAGGRGQQRQNQHQQQKLCGCSHMYDYSFPTSSSTCTGLAGGSDWRKFGHSVTPCFVQPSHPLLGRCRGGFQNPSKHIIPEDGKWKCLPKFWKIFNLLSSIFAKPEVLTFMFTAQTLRTGHYEPHKPVPITGTIAMWPVWSVSLKFLCPWQHSAGWTCGGPAGCCSKLHVTHATLPPAHISETQTDMSRQLRVQLMYFV